MEKTYSRGQMQRAIARATGKNGGTAPAPETPTDLTGAGYKTFGELFAKYQATFPEGTDPETFVSLRDRIWFSGARKSGRVLTAAEQARYDRVRPTVDAEEAVKAAKRAVREAGPRPQAEYDRRDVIVKAMKAAKQADALIDATLTAAKLPLMAAKRPEVAKKAS